MKIKDLDKLRGKAKKQGLNISDDAVFIVRELRSELRIWGILIVTLIVAMGGIGIGLGVAILSSL